MKNNNYYGMINRILTSILGKRSRLYDISSNDIKKSQDKILMTNLRNNSETLIGKKYGFFGIRNREDYRKNVPLSSYEDYSDYISTIMKGKKNILTKEDVIRFVPTSGSSSAKKLIPYTKSLLEEFRNGIFPWLYDLYTKNNLYYGSAYWSITPPAGDTIMDSSYSKIPIGFGNDSDYFGFPQNFLISKSLCVPPEISGIRDIENFKYATAYFLLRDRNLSLISVWSPTFLKVIIDSIFRWEKDIIEGISKGDFNFPDKLGDEKELDISTGFIRKDKARADELKKIFYRGNIKKNELFKEIWPNLRVISCWKDAESEYLSDEIEKLFSGVYIQGKGLLATEGIVSFPVSGSDGHVLAVNSHFLEFLEIDNSVNKQESRFADEIVPRKKYSVVLTTSGGLYRYMLHDIVEVIGKSGSCPVIKFLGKEDNVSDITGEKINEIFVKDKLNIVFRRYGISPDFFLVAPEISPENNYFYVLFIYCGRISFRGLSNDIEREFFENCHYKNSRMLGQLEKLKVFRIQNEDVYADYLKKCIKDGQRLGEIKQRILSRKTGWANVFRGEFVD